MAKKNVLTTSDYFKYPEYLRLLECLNKDKLYKWEMYARLSFCTACRVSDVLNLRWCDILGQSVIFVTEQKTGKTRRIPINPSVQQKFKELYNLCERPDMKDYIIQSSRGDKSVTCQYINQKLKDFKYDYKLDIANFSTHTFRKTFGRYVYDYSQNKSEALLLLNKIFKHSSIEVTKRYIGLEQDKIDDIFSSIQF